MTRVFVPVISASTRVDCSSLVVMLKHSLQSSLSHKTQENKVVQLTEAHIGNNPIAGAPLTVTSVSHPSAFVDGNIPCQFRMENPGGQVTYRVIQVSDVRGKGGAVDVLSSANLTRAQQAVTQTVIQNPLHNGGSPTGERTGEGQRCACFPESSVSEATALSMQTAGDPSRTQTAGQFFVMMSSPDILHSASQRTIAPRAHPYSVKMDSPRTPRDERRRAQHNEVERRRRDKINNWIVTLSKIIPDCSLDSTKSGTSKGGILSKACDYIKDLKENNQQLQEILRGLEREQRVQDLLRQQLEELKSENLLLRAQLTRHGIEAMTDAPAQ